MSSGTWRTCSRTVRMNTPLAEVSSPYFFCQNSNRVARLSSLLNGKPAGPDLIASWRSAERGVWLIRNMALL